VSARSFKTSLALLSAASRADGSYNDATRSPRRFLRRKGSMPRKSPSDPIPVKGGMLSQPGSPAPSDSSSSSDGDCRQLVLVPDAGDGETASAGGRQQLQVGSPCSADGSDGPAHSVDSDDAAELLLMLGGQPPSSAAALPWHTEGLTADASSSEEEEGEIGYVGRRALRLGQSPSQVRL
jgi:hypothetical protein